MRSSFLPRLLMLFLGSACASAAFAQEPQSETSLGISERAAFELMRVKDPALGRIPLNAHWNALMETKQAREFYQQTAARSTALSWLERGPNTDVVGPSNGNTRANGGITAGRIRAVQVDAADATGKTVWVGGVDGGLWKTDDITASPATWTVVNDYLSNLAVSDICQDPTNANIMYFCTGEAYYNADAVQGVGVFKSTDHGVTWSLLGSTTSFTYCTRILCDYLGNVYLATRGNGLRRSSDGGATWVNITPTGMSTNICDLEITSTTGPARLHVVGGIFSTQSYRYTDAPATVSSSTGWVAPVTAFPSYSQRAEIACLGNTLYACPVNASYQVPTIYKSTDGGANWTATASQPGGGTWASAQGWYSLAVGIHPTNPNIVIVGGLDNYKSSDGGASWTKISAWVGTTGQYVHADQHDIQWYDNGNKLIFACDGGIHYSSDGGTTIRDRNAGLRLKQFYSVAIHPTTTNYFLAGSQDNGTHKLTSAGLGGSVEVTGGDGAFVAIDQDQPQYQFGAYVYNQYRRSTDGGNSWSSVNFSSSAGMFINPFTYDNLNNKLYASHNAGVYLRWDNPQSGTTSTTVAIADFNNAKVSALRVSPFTPNRVFFGTAAGRIVRVSDAHLATPTVLNITSPSMPASAYVSCINTGSSEQHLIACFSNYGVMNVWVSHDGGATWTGVDGNLPNMPVRWCMFEPDDDNGAIIATETGIWETFQLDGGNTVWIPSLGFPTVRTDMLAWRASDRTLVAGTHGRGVFSTIIPSPQGCTNPLGLSSSAVNSTSATLSWTAVNGAGSYNVDYRVSGAANWTNAATATASTSLTLNNLQSSTLYEWQVNANCAGSSSPYSQAQFTTTAPPTCDAPTGLNSGSITATSAVLNWTAANNGLSYSVEYKLNAANTWTVANAAHAGTSYTLNGLTPSSTYDWRVMTNCSGATSTYAYGQFTTGAAATCPGIYDVATNGTSGGAATVPFNTAIYGLINPAGDNDYYKFTITTSGTATLTLTNLPANYELYLYSSNGTTQLASSRKSGTQNETISRTFSPGNYFARVVGKGNAFNAANCYNLTIQLGTATAPENLIPINDDQDIAKLYPNPARDLLMLSSSRELDGNSMLTVFDLNGRVLMREPFVVNPQNLDVSRLSPGMYYVRVQTTDGDATYKFVKE